MRKKIYTALITPFTKDGNIDFKALENILSYLMEKAIDGFVVCGTTGESATLNEQEKLQLLKFVIRYTNHKKEIYFGCGSNDTNATIAFIQKVENYQIDGLLVVTPYYNKPTQEGLYMHYHTIASATKLPIMIYEVKNRCGCELLPSTMLRLCTTHKNIESYKYASNDFKKLVQIQMLCPDLMIYCGDDALIKECHELGCAGVISVIAHIYADEIASYYKNEDANHAFFFKRYSYLLMKETNPMCIKYVLSKKYAFSANMRLPLIEPLNATKLVLDAYFDKNY